MHSKEGRILFFQPLKDTYIGSFVRKELGETFDTHVYNRSKANDKNRNTSVVAPNEDAITYGGIFSSYVEILLCVTLSRRIGNLHEGFLNDYKEVRQIQQFYVMRHTTIDHVMQYKAKRLCLGQDMPQKVTHKQSSSFLIGRMPSCRPQMHSNLHVGVSTHPTKAVERHALLLESVDNIGRRHGLALGMLHVEDRIVDEFLEELLENNTSLFVDETRDAFDSTTTSQTTNGRLGDALNVVTKQLLMTARQVAFAAGTHHVLSFATVHLFGSSDRSRIETDRRGLREDSVSVHGEQQSRNNDDGRCSRRNNVVRSKTKSERGPRSRTGAKLQNSKP